MNLEALTLTLQTEFLKRELLGSKIYRVFMPSPHAVLLMLKRERDTTALLAEMNGGSPALYVPERLPENPAVPPAFCMLLRKHLEEGRITRIEQNDMDRVITLEIDMLGASSRIITKKLVFELAGKNSNVLLLQEGTIIDCLKHVSAAQSSYRQLQPGKPYIAPPPRPGMNLLSEDAVRIARETNLRAVGSFMKSFMSTVVGIGKATAQELLLAAGIALKAERLTEGEEASLAEQIKLLQERMRAQQGPVYAVIGRTNQVKTILVVPSQALEQGMRTQSFADLNTAINYSVSLEPIQLPQHEQLEKIVSAELQRLLKKQAVLAADLEKAQNADEQRIIADSLMASVYLLEKGSEQAQITDIYTGEPMTVALAPQLTPVENAQLYYKRYNKYKRAQKEVLLQQEATQEQQLYLESIEASLATASTKAEVEEIRQELIGLGLIRDSGKKNKPAMQKSQPLRIRLNEDVELYIGKNNKQNDYVTFSIAAPGDLWFHTKNIPGSHVVLKTSASEPSAEEIVLAAEFAAYFSKASKGSNVPVDSVQRKFVKKPGGSKPGFVIFTNNKTYYVTPDEEKLKKYL